MMSFFDSFKYAFNGIRQAVFSEKNFGIQLVIGVAAVVLGLFLHISNIEWIIIILCIGIVLTLELINSAIEKICNFICKDFHQQIKIIKDMAAGAVLIVSLTSLLIGIYIFLPKIFIILKSIT